MTDILHDRRLKPLRRADDLLPHPHGPSEPCPGGCRDIDVVTEIVSKTKQEVDELEARIKESHDQLVRFEGRLTEGDLRMGRIEVMLGKNSNAMAQNTTDTAEILQLMRDTKSGFRMLGHLGDALKWLGGIALALGSVWLMVKDFKK